MPIFAQPLPIESLDELFDSVSNWGRWGPDDQRGLLNELTPERTRAAAALIQDGATISCAFPLATAPGPENPLPVVHLMQGAGDVVGEASGGSADYIALSYHGFTVTHIDALCHVMYKGRLYNGFPSSMVTSRGALRGAINTAEHGLSGRGVLLDVPAALGRDWLEPGEAILPEDLDQAEAHARLRVGPGDIVFVRTGRHARLAAGHPLPPRPSETPGPGNIRPFAGLHHTTLAWFNQRRIAVLGGDGFSDVVPAAPHPGAFAFHAVGIPAMGLHLIDNANLEQVRTACQDRNRYEFFLTIAPLRIHGGTGSPINPIAHF